MLIEALAAWLNDQGIQAVVNTELGQQFIMFPRYGRLRHSICVKDGYVILISTSALRAQVLAGVVTIDQLLQYLQYNPEDQSDHLMHWATLFNLSDPAMLELLLTTIKDRIDFLSGMNL